MGLLYSLCGSNSCTSSSKEETLQLPLSLKSHRKGEQLLVMEKQWERDWERWQIYWAVLDFSNMSHCLQGRVQKWETASETGLCSNRPKLSQNQSRSHKWGPAPGSPVQVW